MAFRTQLLLDQVDAFQRAGQWSSAIELCDKVFRDCWRSRDLNALVEIALKTAFLYSSMGERMLAIEHFELVIAISEKTNDLHRQGRALNGLGVLQQTSGELEVARKYYLEAGLAATSGGDSLTSGDISVNLGILANIRGDFAEALAHYRTAFDSYTKVGHRNRLARVLNNLGMLHIDVGEFDEAEDALERGLSISRSVNDVLTEGIIHANKAELFVATDRLQEARNSCDEAFEIASRLGESDLLADVLKCYAIVYRSTGKPRLAESNLLRAIELAQARGNPLLEAEATRELSLVLRSDDRNRESLQALYRAHMLFSTLHAKQDEADIASRLKQLEQDFLSLVAMWGESIEKKDRYTSGHCQRVADYACLVAANVGISEAELIWFRMGAFLHDVGKTEVPEEILNKPGRLTEEEREIIDRHTIAGDQILSAIEFPWDIRPMVRSHHERWDGKGYPDKLEGQAIPFTARILKVADVFDALTSARSYRMPLSAEAAIDLMEEDYGAYDPHLFQTFKALLPSILELMSLSSSASAAEFL